MQIGKPQANLVGTIIVLDINNGIIIVFIGFQHTKSLVTFPIAFNQKPILVYGNESRSSGNGWTLHPVLQAINTTSCNIFQGQYATVLNTDYNYNVYIIGIGY